MLTDSEKTSRVAIFSVYDKDGVWGEYRSYLVTELKKVSQRLFIVVNGTLHDEIPQSISDSTTQIFFRENLGFDAGAYKEILVNHIGLNDLRIYQELILCNDTFFGPFTSFVDIFEDMKKNDADYWGLFRIEERILEVICSCFYVFRLKTNLIADLYSYFKRSINANTTNIYDTYNEYEIGLYSWLRFKNYKSDTYIKHNPYNVNVNGDMALLDVKLPIIKKKFFSSCTNKENIVHALQLIYYSSRYSIDYILNYTDLSIYEINCIDDVVNYELQQNKLNTSRQYFCQLTKVFLLSYIDEASDIYIYGNGIWADFIYGIYFKNTNKLNGFIISKEKCKHNMYDLPIYSYDKYFDEKNVIVAMSASNTRDLILHIGKKVKWLYLW
ncbi:MAG: hypothetical protein IJ849_06350 [Selenomonadaceae bacterium]|nr:hypothetical protein [Selenomonadaceae bacterium]